MGGPDGRGAESVTHRDACDGNQHPIDTTPVVFDGATRATASYRNICFQVWQPGVTDTNSPSSWQQLDVEVHYRYGTSGDFQIGVRPGARITRPIICAIRGPCRTRSNRSKDTPSLAAIPVPFHIDSEVPEPDGGGYAEIDADMEFYFTVNGEISRPRRTRRSTSTTRARSESRFSRRARVPYVLHPIVTCSGLQRRYRRGPDRPPDITDASAIASACGAGAARSSTGRATSTISTRPPAMSMVLDNETPVTGSTIPSFISLSGAKFEPDGTTLDLSLAVYDRTTSSSARSLTTSFANCVLAPPSDSDRRVRRAGRGRSHRFCNLSELAIDA